MPRPDPGDDDLLTRSVRVLEALAGMEQPATLPSVVDRVRLPQGQVYRTLRALQRRGWVDHTPKQGYRVGARGIGLGTLLAAHPALREVARTALVRLARATGTTVTFALRSGHDRVLTLAAVPPGEAGGAPVALGERAPLVRGCSGRAILAHLSATEVDGVLAVHPVGEGDAALRAELARIVRDGYALSFADNHDRVNGLSVPLLPPDDPAPLGSLTVSGPADRFDEAALRALAGPLTHAAGELAPRLAALIGPAASTGRGPLDVAVPSPATPPSTDGAGS